MTARLKSVLCDERGFSMVAVMGLLLIGTLFAVAAFQAANNDIPVSQKDLDSHRAYAAAQAGINYYLYNLYQNSSYWSTCPSTPSSTPVNQPWNGQGSDPRTWQNVPNSKASYTIEVVPQNGYTTCSTTQTQASMINNSTGTLQIKATGRSNAAKRAIVATLKRAGFLDYLWFTNYEDGDPLYYGSPSTCATIRSSSPRNNDGNGDPCTEIEFATGDSINGPMHTNDSSILVGGSPTFGRNSSDSIEIAGPSPGWIGSGSPVFNGTLKTNAPTLTMPSTNSSLETVPGVLTYTGTTVINFNSNGTMNVTTSPNGNGSFTTTNNVALPSSGVIYVKNGSCGWSYSLPITYNAPAGCGDLYVQGTYSQSLTLATDNDIIVTGNLTYTNNAVLGLIPHNFVRVFHPVSTGGGGFGGGGGSCNTASTGPYGASGVTGAEPYGITIDAAILALNHSFLVDNYNCGSPLGTLTVNGAIAQWFRGVVGQPGTSGYTKNYTYDNRLKIQTPPDFLSPLQADWRVGRETEVTPAY